MGAEVFNTPLGWIVFALIFGVMPTYAAFRTSEFFSHIDQHLSKRAEQAAAGKMETAD